MKKCVLIIALIIGLQMPLWAESILIVADEWPQMDYLAKQLQEKEGYEVKKVEQDEFPDNLSDFHAAISFIHGSMDGNVAKKLMDFTKDGGRLLVLHHGISSGKKKTPGWLPFLGIELDRNKDSESYYYWQHDVDYYLVNLVPGHYVTSHKVNYDHEVKYQPSDSPSIKQTLPALKFEKSEVFINHQFTDARAKRVLFGCYWEDPQTGKIIMQDRFGWFKRAVSGWVFYLQPGHLLADFKNPNYQQIIFNCLKWRPGINRR